MKIKEEQRPRKRQRDRQGQRERGKKNENNKMSKTFIRDARPCDQQQNNKHIIFLRFDNIKYFCHSIRTSFKRHTHSTRFGDTVCDIHKSKFLFHIFDLFFPFVVSNGFSIFIRYSFRCFFFRFSSAI